MHRQFLPFINFDDFKKILNNLHKHSCRTDISLTYFKNEVVKSIGYQNFSHFKNAIIDSRKDDLYLSYGNSYDFSQSNGSFILDAIYKKVRTLLGIPFDLYTEVLEQQVIRFSNKKPFLIVNGKIYTQDNFHQGLEDIKKTANSFILLCMANDSDDARACFSSVMIEKEVNHIRSYYDDSNVNEVRDLALSHLQPACASPLWVMSEHELNQMKRPDIAMRHWAKINNDNNLQKLLDISESDNRFRCRVYYDEYTHNCKPKNNLIIKARRVYTIELSTPDGLYIMPLDTLSKTLFNEDIDLNKMTPSDIIYHVKTIKNRLIEKHGINKVSIYVISNGVSYLDSLDKEMVISLSDALRGSFSSHEHLISMLTAFGLKRLVHPK